MDNKIALRTKAKELRKTLDIEKISSCLLVKIRQTCEYNNAQNIMLFYPKKYETNLLELLKDNKTFYLPRVNGENLEICPYKLGDELKKSEFNVHEPTSIPVEIATIDLIFVPALAIDEQGYRLGYGGGYYDRLLKNFKGVTICALPKELVIKTLPKESHDIKISKIITT